MLLISYALNGRFGNNLFQYLATKIVQHILSKYDMIYTYTFNIIPSTPFIINEDNYKHLIEQPDEYLPKLSGKDIYLDGYFQYDFHIRKYSDYVSALLNSLNTENINHQYTVSTLARYIHGQTIEVDKEALYIHVRLDDFIPEKACMKVGSYLKIVNTILSEHTFPNVIIIVDKIRYKFEEDYLKCLHTYLTSKKLTVGFQQGDMLTDFAKLVHAEYLLSSNSTFCYLAGLLGKHKKSWCPVNTRYSHQHITHFDDNTVPFDIEYI